VHVGVSVDGPDELNGARWAGSEERTREATARTHAAIARLCAEGLVPSVIVTLHRGNTGDRLPRLLDWLLGLERLGVTTVRIHNLQADTDAVRAAHALTPRENVELFLALEQFEANRLTTLSFDIFDETRRLLSGRDRDASCVWQACDPYTTHAVQGVEGRGQRSNCGRTNKDGAGMLKAAEDGYERYVALYHAPQEYGGCSGCRFFVACKGQCPGTAIDGDWRNRSEDCPLWFALFERAESRLLADGIEPVSLSSHRRALEEAMVQAWQHGSSLSVAEALESLAVAT